VASWFVCSTPDQEVQARVLARVILLFSWARHFTFTVPLSTQVYKWVPANLMLGVILQPRAPQVLPEKLGGAVWPTSQNPYPIYDQNLHFLLPYL